MNYYYLYIFSDFLFLNKRAILNHEINLNYENSIINTKYYVIYFVNL
jgi:hypothetical protein